MRSLLYCKIGELRFTSTNNQVEVNQAKRTLATIIAFIQCISRLDN